MIKYFLVTAVFIFGLTLLSFSQEIDDIATDRPDQTETSNTVPSGFLQVEIGYTYERDAVPFPYNYDPNRKIITETNSPAILLRYGISNNVELRLSSEYSHEKMFYSQNVQTITSTDGITSGISPITVGTKIKLFDEKKARPETAFIFHLDIPFDTKSIFQTEYVSPSFRFSCSHTLSNRFSLGYNLGGEWENNKDNSTSTGIYTFTLGADIMNKLGGYVELYGFLTQDEMPDHRFDAGLTYLIRKNIQLDVSGGIGITEISPDYFIGAGLSFRIPR